MCFLGGGQSTTTTSRRKTSAPFFTYFTAAQFFCVCSNGQVGTPTKWYLHNHSCNKCQNSVFEINTSSSNYTRGLEIGPYFGNVTLKIYQKWSFVLRFFTWILKVVIWKSVNFAMKGDFNLQNCQKLGPMAWILYLKLHFYAWDSFSPWVLRFLKFYVWPKVLVTFV